MAIPTNGTTDTPRTDNVLWIDSRDVEVCTAHFARRLERDLSRSVDALRGMYGLLQLFAARPEIAKHLGDWESNHRAEEARNVMALDEAHTP